MEKRLFIGIEIIPSEDLLELILHLKQVLNNEGIKWVEPSNFHLTLMFLGNVSLAKIQIINKALMGVRSSHNLFEARLVNLGKFNYKGKTNVIWINFQDEGQIQKLAKDIITALSELGFCQTTESFKPHLTVARVKTKCNEDVLDYQINSSLNKVVQMISISEFCLFESILKPVGPIYKVIERYKLSEFN